MAVGREVGPCLVVLFAVWPKLPFEEHARDLKGEVEPKEELEAVGRAGGGSSLEGRGARRPCLPLTLPLKYSYRGFYIKNSTTAWPSREPEYTQMLF